MDDDMPPRLPPRYSSLPRRYTNANGRDAAYNQYDASETGPSPFNVPAPQPFDRDYQQSSSRSFANQQLQNRESVRRMGNGHSAQVREAGVDAPRDWLQAPPPQQPFRQPQHGPGRPPTTIRRSELESAAEHSVLPDGPRVPGQPTKKKKSLRKRFGSFLSYTIRQVVSVINGTSAADRRARAENQYQAPPKRTQSLTRIDTRSEDVPHRRTQSVRAPPRREEPVDEMHRYPLRTAPRVEPRVEQPKRNGSRGLYNIGNSCYVAAAVQSLRPVVTDTVRELRVSENAEDLIATKQLFEKLDNGQHEESQFAFERFVDLFCRLRSVMRGDQDDASLCLVDILSRLHESTKSPLPPASPQKMVNLTAREAYYWKNRAEENSPFYDLVNSVLQTKSICFTCSNSSLTFHNDTLIPCVIPPEIAIFDTYEPLRANFVRSIGGRCLNVRAHLNRFPSNPDPLICELKHQMYDHELIHPFDVTRTEVFTHGRDGWEWLGATDNTIVRHRRNEYLSVVEFPQRIEDRLVVLCSYGGETSDDGPLFFTLKLTSTVQDLREKMRDYLRAYHPFPCDVYMTRERYPTEKEAERDECMLESGPLIGISMVAHNVRVLEYLYPHLPKFIRVNCRFDTTAVRVDDSNDAVSLHRSAKRAKYAKKHKFRIDVDYVLKSYMHDTKVEWRCANGHTDKSGQIISYCYPAEFIFIQIRRVDHNYNGDTYKVHNEVHVPTLIDIAPIYRQDWPDKSHFYTPRAHRPRMMYELVSVISHEGGSSSSGHYTSYVYDPRSKRFTKYSDDMVREAPREAIHVDPFVVIYRSRPHASFEETNYGIVQAAPDAEDVQRMAEKKAEDADERSEGNIAFPELQRRRSHVKFDKSNEPRYHPDRPPADLKSSKRKKPKK
ncbi:hypothetical protein PMAYCL1PPCAC_32644 [Pristionchus mayeri]|uniref:Ubiquitin carboxyl-terminal hydrolase n=1 Tax=Pristionchus mayeri TaxID=1317129 RepID=A0AAN5DFW0_9BILA|nr:hypothetical protein PMAYCL1PPCAC_32644 [Pristionchus mayeri]